MSLRWICVVTLALLCCLTAQPIPVDKDEILLTISTFLPSFSTAVENAKCQDVGRKYYSPVNVKENCLGSALHCYFKEVSVLIDDCDVDLMSSADPLMTTLDGIKNSLAQCEEFICEVHPEKPFKEFLENMKTLLQQIASTAR